MIDQIKKDLEILYKDKPRRLKHIYGVRDTAVSLGELHNLDTKKLELSALLHDITKYYTFEQNKKIIEEHYDNHVEIINDFNENILHAFSARVIAKQKYNIKDIDILDSILYHTIGKENMTPYEQIIFLSDYIEPNRTYQSCINVRNITKKNIKMATYQAIYDYIEHHESKNMHIPTQARKAVAFYKQEVLMDKLKLVIDALESVNLFDIVVYDMREKSPFFDYFIVSSSTSERQLNATLQHVSKNLVSNNYDAPNVEGKNSNSWILIDCKDIVVNVFTKEEREYYNLEKMLAEIDNLDLEKLRWFTKN